MNGLRKPFINYMREKVKSLKVAVISNEKFSGKCQIKK
jgi:hypothetical protein